MVNMNTTPKIETPKKSFYPKVSREKIAEALTSQAVSFSIAKEESIKDALKFVWETYEELLAKLLERDSKQSGD